MGLIRAPAATIGFMPHQLGLGSADINLNAAVNRAGFRFTVNASKTLSSLTLYTGSIVGSPTGGCEIFAMGADGNPTGAALADSTTHSANPIGSGTTTFSGYSLALTAGNWYIASFRNTHATPASNSYRCVFEGTGGIPYSGFGLGAAFNWGTISSTDSGSSWTGAGTGTTSLSLIFDDATTVGWPFRGQINTGTADGVYGTRELGNRITTPAGASLNLIGIGFSTRSVTGTPTGSLVCKVRLSSDNSLLGTTQSMSPAVTIAGNLKCVLVFTDVVVLSASTQYDILVAETTQSDTSGNRYNFEGITIPAGLATVPWSMKKIYYNGTSWSETTTEIFRIWGVLDEIQSVAGGAGGGGPLIGGRLVGR